MDPHFVTNGIRYILASAVEQDGYKAWTPRSANLSHTVTAQVLITLLRFRRVAGDSKLIEQVDDAISSGFTFLQETLENDGDSLPSFAYTLLAHIEACKHDPAKSLDQDLVIVCWKAITGTKYRNQSPKGHVGYLYSSGCTRKYFPTILVVKAFLALLDYLHETSASVENLPKPDELQAKINEGFAYIVRRLGKTENPTFDEAAEYYSLGLEILPAYESFHQRFSTTDCWPNRNEFRARAVDHFSGNIDQVFDNWLVRIDSTPFKLVYVANLATGLFLQRDRLEGTGFALLYKLAHFICTDERIHRHDPNGRIAQTNTDGDIWGTAHTLGEILIFPSSIAELKWLSACADTQRRDAAQATPPQASTTQAFANTFSTKVFNRTFVIAAVGSIVALALYHTLSDNKTAVQWIGYILMITAYTIAIFGKKH